MRDKLIGILLMSPAIAGALYGLYIIMEQLYRHYPDTFFAVIIGIAVLFLFGVGMERFLKDRL